MGYGWSRRLRPSPSSLVPRFPRHPYLLRRRLPGFLGQCAGKGTMHPSTEKLLGHLRHMAIEEKELLTRLGLQWISEVLHFCQGLPIILVGCKKDLRYDQKTIEELHKTSQKPVTPEQVSFPNQSGGPSPSKHTASCALGTICCLKQPFVPSISEFATDMYIYRARR